MKKKVKKLISLLLYLREIKCYAAYQYFKNVFPPNESHVASNGNQHEEKKH